MMKRFPSLSNANYELRIMRYALAFFVLTLVALFSVSAVAAQSPTPSDDEVNAVARHLFCPVCENTPLDVCPTDACKEWREEIRTLLAEGKTQEEIFQYFERQHGAKVLSEPPREGFYWLIYVIPLVVILAGAAIFFRSMKEWTHSQQPAAAELPADPDDYLARMEEELKKRK